MDAAFHLVTHRSAGGLAASFSQALHYNKNGLLSRRLTSHLLLWTVLPLTARAADSYADIVPILEDHCQECHRKGEIGPMPLTTYREVRPWAKAIRDAVTARKMPPWFADPHYGKFANNRSLSHAEIDRLAAWLANGAPEGPTSPTPRSWPVGWAIGKPDAVARMPHPFRVPGGAEIAYQYFIVPSGFTLDRWVQKAELRPGDRSVVHHAVVYIREPGSPWLRSMPMGGPVTVPAGSPDAVTKSDILFTYTPGNGYDEWPQGTAKLVPAGSDFVFEIHYTPAKQPVFDLSSIGFVFATAPPIERVLTLQLTNDRLLIPPGHPDYRASVGGTLPNDARLLSLYPHMHLRGKSFDYAVVEPDGRRTTLLKVDNYDFYWQLNYRLADPLTLLAGTRLECSAVFDNSKNNPRNPDPEAMVRYGQRSSDEMMIGFFDVAVPANMDKTRFFERRSADVPRALRTYPGPFHSGCGWAVPSFCVDD